MSRCLCARLTRNLCSDPHPGTTLRHTGCYHLSDSDFTPSVTHVAVDMNRTTIEVTLTMKKCVLIPRLSLKLCNLQMASYRVILSGHRPYIPAFVYSLRIPLTLSTWGRHIPEPHVSISMKQTVYRAPLGMVHIPKVMGCGHKSLRREPIKTWSLLVTRMLIHR